MKTRCLSNLQIVKHLNDSFISLRYELIGWCKRTCGRVLMTPNKITVRYVNWGEHVRNQNNLLLGLATGKRWSYVTKQGRKYRNSKTIHFLSTHPTCKKGETTLKGIWSYWHQSQISLFSVSVWNTVVIASATRQDKIWNFPRTLKKPGLYYQSRYMEKKSPSNVSEFFRCSSRKKINEYNEFWPKILKFNVSVLFNPFLLIRILPS